MGDFDIEQGIIGEQKRILRGFARRKRERILTKNNKNFDIKIFVVWKNFPNRDNNKNCSLRLLLIRKKERKD